MTNKVMNRHVKDLMALPVRRETLAAIRAQAAGDRQRACDRLLGRQTMRVGARKVGIQTTSVRKLMFRGYGDDDG